MTIVPQETPRVVLHRIRTSEQSRTRKTHQSRNRQGLTTGYLRFRAPLGANKAAGTQPPEPVSAPLVGSSTSARESVTNPRSMAPQSFKQSVLTRLGNMRTRTFLIMVGALLTGTLGLMLTLNTMMAQGSFTRFDLASQNNELGRQQQALSQELAALQSPFALQRRAEALGMVPSTSPLFIDLSTGQVIGEHDSGEAYNMGLPETLSGYLDPLDGRGQTLAQRKQADSAADAAAAQNAAPNAASSANSSEPNAATGERSLGLREAR